MKVVLDTNILIDGFKDDYSFEKKIIDAVLEGDLEAYANKRTLRENRRLSSQLIENPGYQNFLEKFFESVRDVYGRQRLNVVRDPEDNKILESALSARAEYLITNDNDLLTLEEFRGIKIVRPAEFWAKFKDEGMEFWKDWTKFITGK
jgi:putative PIN family toxin of toxin-antitoxin system